MNKKPEANKAMDKPNDFADKAVGKAVEKLSGRRGYICTLQELDTSHGRIHGGKIYEEQELRQSIIKKYAKYLIPVILFRGKWIEVKEYDKIIAKEKEEGGKNVK